MFTRRLPRIPGTRVTVYIIEAPLTGLLVVPRDFGLRLLRENHILVNGSIGTVDAYSDSCTRENTGHEK